MAHTKFDRAATELCKIIVPFNSLIFLTILVCHDINWMAEWTKLVPLCKTQNSDTVVGKLLEIVKTCIVHVSRLYGDILCRAFSVFYSKEGDDVSLYFTKNLFCRNFRPRDLKTCGVFLDCSDVSGRLGRSFDRNKNNFVKTKTCRK